MSNKVPVFSVPSLCQGIWVGLGWVVFFSSPFQVDQLAE